MTASDVIEALPVRGRWDFGGYPYGLEPLTLPLTASGQRERRRGIRRSDRHGLGV